MCGDFNDKLLQALDGYLQQHGISQTLLVAVGHNLCAKLPLDRDMAATLDGPGVAEEVEAVLNDLLEAFNRLQAEHGWQALTVLHHATEDAGVRVRQLFPRFQETPTRPATGYPPLLNLAPEAFLAELLDHYLFAALHEMFYTSLTAENHQRMEHLQRALDRLEQQTAEPSRVQHPAPGGDHRGDRGHPLQRRGALPALARRAGRSWRRGCASPT